MRTYKLTLEVFDNEVHILTLHADRGAITSDVAVKIIDAIFDQSLKAPTDSGEKGK